MEKSFEHLKKIERLSRQARHHRVHLNKLHENELSSKLDELNLQQDQTIIRSQARRQLEHDRKALVHITVDQIARDRQEQIDAFARPKTRNEPIRTKVKTPKSCQLFSSNCQLYPCQPVYHYSSFIRKENDRTLCERTYQRDSTSSQSNRPEWHEAFVKIQEKKYEKNRRPMMAAIQNQNHLVNRHLSMQRTMAKLDEQSRLLKEKLNDKRTFGYVREHRQKLSNAIQRHLEISAKVCA